MWVLFVILAVIVLSVIDAALGLGGRTQYGAQPMAGGVTGFNYGASAAGGVLTGIFSLVILVPNFAVQVRRLHDTNRTGWWLLMPFIPYVVGLSAMVVGIFSGNTGAAIVGGLFSFVGLIAAIVVLVFLCLDGTRGPNRFGPDPKDPAGDLESVFR